MNNSCKCQQLFLLACGFVPTSLWGIKRLYSLNLELQYLLKVLPKLSLVSVSSLILTLLQPPRYCSTSASRLSHCRQLEAELEPFEQSKSGARELQGETLLWTLLLSVVSQVFKVYQVLRSSATVGARLLSLCPPREGH